MAVLRNIIAFPVASLVAGIAYASMYNGSGVAPDAILPAIGLASVVALLHAVVLGVPSALVLRHFGKLKLPYILACAFLIGALPLPLGLLFAGSVSWTLRESVLSMAFCGVLGLVAGAVWFYVSDLSSNTSFERTREG